MAEQSFEQAVRESRMFYRRRLAQVLLRDCIQHWRFNGEADFVQPLSPEQLAQRAATMADALTKALVVIEETELRGDPASPPGDGK